jgi:predicted RNA-binding protein associated with RNAse of E/G family
MFALISPVQVITMNKTVTIIKRNPLGQETWRYSGQVLAHDNDRITLEAFFNRPDLPFHGILLAEGDRFVETYFTRQWYNIFEIHDKQDNHIKGWYCNVALPAVIKEGQVDYVDLALDLLVYPDGRQLALDEDEFQALPIDADTRNQALTAMQDLQDLAANGKLAQEYTDPEA